MEIDDVTDPVPIQVSDSLLRALQTYVAIASLYAGRQVTVNLALDEALQRLLAKFRTGLPRTRGAASASHNTRVNSIGLPGAKGEVQP